VQFLTNFGWVFLITWLPRFLAEKYNVPVVQRGWMSSLPILIGMGGMFAGGWLTDYLAQRLGRRWGRALPLVGSRFLVAAAFFACLLLDAPWPITVAMALVAVCTDLGTPALWAFNLDVGGKYVGAVLGWGNMWGNLGAAVSPLALNWIIEGWGWDSMFIACGAAFVLAGLLAFFVDANSVVVPEENAVSSS
jgi:nitrate/nitrite transporter NarK